MELTPVIVVDADPAVYRAAFAAQVPWYVVGVEYPDGFQKEIWCEGDSRMLQSSLRDIGCEILYVESRPEAKPVGVALEAADFQFQKIYRQCSQHLEEMGAEGTASMELIVSAGGNFRKDLATIKTYKGNRAALVKPVHYLAVREHLEHQWSAYFVDEREADDEVSIRMHKYQKAGRPSILVTIDKDLDQIPGWHYDYKNHVFYNVEPTDAMLLLYAQVLSGDTTDNIPGLKGYGPVKSLKKVNEWYEYWDKHFSLQGAISVHAWIWDHIKTKYTNEGGVAGYTGPLTPEEQAVEVARLVYLQTAVGELWYPPGYQGERVRVGLNEDDI